MCLSELGPGTEYGHLDVAPEGDWSDEPKVSRDLVESRISSLVALIPCARALPYSSETPVKGVFL